MDRIGFEIMDDAGKRNYMVHIENLERIVSEFEAIEIMVSFIRALSEIEYISCKKPEVFDSTERLQLVIMEKDLYGLRIVLKKNIVGARLFNSPVIEYSIEEIQELVDEIYQILNKKYSHNKFDFRMFSPIYLEHMLGVDIPHIENVKFERCNILSLYFYNRTEPKRVKINEHNIFKQLKTGEIETGSMDANHYLESNEERLRKVLSEVNDNPETFCAVVYGNENVVRDGTHRLACMYYLYGDIEIPIIRIYITDPYYSYTMYRAWKNNIYKEVIR